MSKTICLNMIVKDESHVIAKTLKNISENIKITDWVICDTGSTDGTQEIIKNTMKELGIPGRLMEDKWKNFSHNRTLALQYARMFSKSDYVLIFDADDHFEGHFKLPEDFGKDDAYFLTLSTCPGFFYKRPLICSNKKNFFFEGVLHEFLHTKEKCSFGSIEGDYFVFGGTIGNDEAKYKRDVEVIKTELETNKDMPGYMKSRYLFYLAQSYRDSGQKKEAIEAYRKRILEGEGGGEVYICFYEIGNLYLDLGDVPNAVFYFLQATQANNKRVEHTCKLMGIFRELGQPAVSQSLYRSIPKDVYDIGRNCDFLFVHKDMYDWKIHYESTVVSAHYGDFDVEYQFNRIYQYKDDINNKDIFKNCADNLVIYIRLQDTEEKKAKLIELKSKFEDLYKEKKEPFKVVVI